MCLLWHVPVSCTLDSHPSCQLILMAACILITSYLRVLFLILAPCSSLCLPLARSACSLDTIILCIYASYVLRCLFVQPPQAPKDDDWRVGSPPGNDRAKDVKQRAQRKKQQEVHAPTGITADDNLHCRLMPTSQRLQKQGLLLLLIVRN